MVVIDRYRIIEKSGRLILKDMVDFNPKHIFECGQAFRWKVEEDGSYTTISNARALNVKVDNKDIVLRDTNMEEFKEIWYNYFDLDRDYGKIKEDLSKDPVLREAIEFGDGLRILNQSPFETIISFIISANNQIPRIKNSIELIARHYGERIEQGYGAGNYYSFPQADVLASLDVEELKEVSRVGFRAERIIETSKIISRGDLDVDSIYKLNRSEGKEILMTLPGVGPKVSDCILLFAFNKDEAFPVDVWVKRVMEYFYLKKETNVKEIGEHGAKIFGNLAGYAQQYLFYYARELGIGK